MIELLAFASLILVIATLGLVTWTVLRWPRLTTSRERQPEAISVLIPARDEALNIADCVAAALASGDSVHEVVVYDDRSTDGTAAIVRREADRDERVRLLEGTGPAPGWCGKTFACAELARAARAPWLLYLDADARIAPGAADRLLAEATERRATLISVWPALVMESFWERALMPMLNVITFALFPAPLSFRRDDPSLALVHGACILVRRDAYERVGGHTAVKGEIFEDQRLAQLWRQRGERSCCLDGQQAVSVRMYRTFGEIWRGFQKNFYPAFEREWTFWGFLLLHASVFVVPLLLVVLAPSWISASAAAGVLVIRTLLNVRFGHPALAIVMHPIAEVVLFGIAIGSWWRCRSGRGVEWKGRRYLARDGDGASS